MPGFERVRRQRSTEKVEQPPDREPEATPKERVADQNPVLRLQRSIGNQAMVRLLAESRSNDVVRRSGGSVRDRAKFFESGGSSLKQEQQPEGEQPIVPKAGRMFSFADALKVFEHVESSGIKDSSAKDAPEPTPTETPTTVETETRSEEPPVEDDLEAVLDDEVDDDVEAHVDDADAQEQKPRSFEGGEWRGRAMHHDYRKERKGYDKSTGLAYASWVKQGPQYVKYLTKEQRAAYELKLVKQNGVDVFFMGDQPLDTSKMKRSTFFKDDISGALDSASGNVIFVMDVEGRIYVADEGAEAHAGGTATGTQWRFNHSSFVKGKPIASAGELWFKDGALTGITDNSGHYKPDFESTLQLLRNFNAHGVNLQGVKVQRRLVTKLVVVDAEEMLAGGTANLALDGRSGAEGAMKKATSSGNLHERAEHVKDAAASLVVAARQPTGLNLSPELTQAVEMLATICRDARRDVTKLFDDEAENIAAWVWGAVSNLDDVEPKIFTVEAYKAAEQLDDDRKVLFAEDDDTRHEAAALLDQLIAGISVDAAKEYGPRGDEEVPRDELEAVSKHTKEYLAVARSAVTSLKRLRDAQDASDLTSLLAGRDQPLARAALRKAATDFGVSLDDVVDWLAEAGDVAPAICDVLARLVPGKAARIKELTTA